mgnify:CR=1 FL=1
MDERGVSEALGFVLIFSLILLMTGAIYTGGIGELKEVRDDQQVAGVERAFTAIGSDVTDVVRDGSPSRSSTIRLNDGTLTFGNQTWVNVTVDGERVNNSVTPLVYRLNGEPQLAYTAGMVTRSGGGGGWAVTTEPPVIAVGGSPHEAVFFPIVDLDGEGRVGGARAVTVQTESGDGAILGERRRGNPLDVNVTVTDTPRSAAWGRYLESALDADCESIGENAVGCDFEARSFRTSFYTVEMSFS